MVKWEINASLTQSEFVDSMREEIFLLPFTNCLFERIFPTRTKIEGNSLIVDMSDGTTFKIQVTKM
jgi:hypothetical protein